MFAALPAAGTAAGAAGDRDAAAPQAAQAAGGGLGSARGGVHHSKPGAGVSIENAAPENRSAPFDPADITIFEYDIDTDEALLDAYCKNADFVFHLAGVNRPQDPAEFMTGNFGFTSTLLELLKKHGNNCPIMISSSIQAALNNPYGESKKAGEDLIFAYGQETGAEVLVYRFPNVFGKWCRPNYNSAVATFCNNIARGLPITVNDPSVNMTLVYIDDVVRELIAALAGQANKQDDGYCKVPVEHKITLGEIVELLYSFRDGRGDVAVSESVENAAAGSTATDAEDTTGAAAGAANDTAAKQTPTDASGTGMNVAAPTRTGNLSIPDMTDNSFSKKLYSTYLSYLPEDKFAYPLKMNVDDRGSFTEILRTGDRGQVSVNISKPGITKGNHWHHTKNEKFVVVSGTGLIQLRRVGLDENGQPYPVVEYRVSGDEITVVDMIPGYTHNIINLSETEDLVTVMWANESFDPERPDTYFEPVE